MLGKLPIKVPNARSRAFSVHEFPFGNYSGFTPNSIFFSCRPADTIVYAIVQHLAFHSRKITPKIVRSKCGLPERTVGNALTRLKQKGLIQKGDDWLFLHEPSQKMVGAKALIKDNLGYYVRMHDLLDASLSSEEILAMAIMYNLIASTPRMHISYIAKVFRKSKLQTKLTLTALASKGYILRTREHCRKAYLYRIVPAVSRKRMTTQGTTEVKNLSTDNLNPPQNDTSNPPHYDTSYINGVFITKCILDSGNNNQQVAYTVRRDPFLEKEMQEVVLPYTEKLAKSLPQHSEAVEQELKEKSSQYTHALEQRSKELRATQCVCKETYSTISDLEVGLGALEIKKKKIDHGLNVWLRYIADPRAAISQRLVPLNAEEINMLEGTVRAVTPKFSTEAQNKMAFCLLFNSLVKDVADRYTQWFRNDDKGQKAKRDAITKSITGIKSKSYELNVAVYPKSTKRLK